MIPDKNTETVDSTAHKRLLAGVNQIVKTQHVKIPTRYEPSIHKSEFHLSKKQLKKKKNTLVNVDNLLKTLDKTKSHPSLGLKLKKIQKNNRILQTPVAKHALEKIQRSVGYRKITDQLNRWDAVVTKNRVAEQQSFPAVDEGLELSINDGNNKNSSNVFANRFKSDLMKEMEKLEPQTQHNSCGSESDIVPLTLEEMKEKSYELKKKKQQEAYLIAKGRRKNKIKSKTYHKLLKREKLKKQIHNFESLQKSDPEAALRELEKIDKHRASERITLRHKNTGTWAKNVKVRAKYDKDARQELEEQIQLSRQLTDKHEIDEESSENEEEINLNEGLENPWTSKKHVEQTNDVDDFTQLTSNYKKYWTERNENVEKRRIYDTKLVDTGINDDTDSDSIELETYNNKKDHIISTSEWNVEDLIEENIAHKSLDEIFDEAEERIGENVTKKLNKIRSTFEEGKSKANKNNKKNLKTDMSFKEKNKRVIIDEDFNQIEKDDSIFIANSNLEETKININPDKFVAIKPKHLLTEIPNIDDDIDESTNTEKHKITISEAFQDDDIVADFVQEKEEEKNKSTPKDIDLTLPGWGSWAGAGIRPQKRRVIFKVPENISRKDDNKKRLIINEKADEKFKSHLVSQLPFPFTSVRDYEASIRTPIGKEFVPQTAHKVLTKPKVVTKLGKIIKPMDAQELCKNSNKINLKALV